MVTRLLCALLIAASAPWLAAAQERALPRVIDPQKHYVFYLYGLYIDKRGPRGVTDYPGILDALEDMGLMVIGEPGTLLGNDKYAAKVADGVHTLLAAGVPATHITVAGHSKGGFIALLAAVQIANPAVSYAVFGGCSVRGTGYRRRYMRFVNGDAQRLAGRFVIAWADDDPLAGSCDEAMQKASVTYRNVVLPAGLGHRLYFQPNALWLDVLREHALR